MAYKVALVVGGLVLASGVVDSRGGVPFRGHPECDVEQVTAENMLDPSMPWMPDPQECPEFYEGDPDNDTGVYPEGFVPSNQPAIVPEEWDKFTDWGGPWYLEGPSCWASSDC